MRVEGVESRDEYLFYFFQGVQPHFKQRLVFELAAKVLHGPGDTGMQLFPIDAVATLYRSVNTGFFQGNLLPVYLAFAYLSGVGGGLPARISARGGRVAVVTGGKGLLPGDI